MLDFENYTVWAIPILFAYFIIVSSSFSIVPRFSSGSHVSPVLLDLCCPVFQLSEQHWWCARSCWSLQGRHMLRISVTPLFQRAYHRGNTFCFNSYLNLDSVCAVRLCHTDSSRMTLVVSRCSTVLRKY